MTSSRCSVTVVSGTASIPVRFAREGLNGAFDFDRVAHVHANRLDCKRRRGGFEGAPERFREGGGLRIEEQCDPFKSRRKLLEQGQPFPDNVLLEGGETGNVAARP